MKNWKPLGPQCVGDFYVKNGTCYPRPKVRPINGVMYLVLSSSLKIPVNITIELSSDDSLHIKRGSYSYNFPKKQENA
jgi:hypothetical protein